MTISAPPTARGSGPSLAKLVSHVPEARRWRRQADALIVIGRQLELMAQEQGVRAHVALGTLRFSLFHMHQGRIAQLVPFCQSVTVYGEADAEPPALPNVTFVPVPAGAPLSQEWFLVIDSPVFWGTLVAQAIAERANGAVRRYQFEGVLSPDERVVSRASLLLSLARGQATPEVSGRDAVANQARWARLAYALASHPEAARLSLAGCLGELPELQSLLVSPALSPDEIVPLTIDSLRRHCGAVGELLYRHEAGQLVPVAWSAPGQPPARPAHDGLAGQAFKQGQLVLEPLLPSDPEHGLLGPAESAAAIPVSVGGSPWGVLLVGQQEPDAHDSPTAARAVGLATLLEQLLEAAAPPPPSQPPAMPAPSFAPPAPAPSFAPQPSTQPAQPSFAAQAPVPAAPNFAPPAPAPAAPSFGLPPWLRGNGNGNGQRQLAGAAPEPVAPAPLAPAVPAPAPGVDPSRGFPALQKRLMGALVAFDQRAAEQIWAEACSLFSTESVCTDLLMPVQIAVGEGWHRGEVSVAAEHFCSRFVEGKLLNLLNANLEQQSGPLAIIGCAQAELHELGAIMLSLFMKWAGFRVIYLGQNVPNSTIEETVRQLRPQVLGLSATTVEAAHNLTETGQLIARMEQPRPLFIFGGMAFYERPDLRGRIHGHFLEGDIRQIIRQLAEKLRNA